jgi:hypothetical protein
MQVEDLTPESSELDVREAIKASIHQRLMRGMTLKKAADLCHRIAKRKTSAKIRPMQS